MSDRQNPLNRTRWRRRYFHDRMARYGIAFGGIGVIFAVVLIFFYLLYVVLPIFQRASLEPVADYVIEEAKSETLWLALEEQGTLAVRYLKDGRVQFFDTRDGTVKAEKILPLEGARITAVAAPSPASDLVAFGTNDGRVLVVRHRFEVSYPDDVRTLTPIVEYPLGKTLIVLDQEGGELSQLALQQNEETMGGIAVSSDKRLIFVTWLLEQSFMGDGVVLEQETRSEQVVKGDTARLLLSPDLHFAYRAREAGSIEVYQPDEDGLGNPEIVEALPNGENITDMQFLLGDYALLIGDSSGVVTEWFPVRDENDNYRLTRIREFHSASNAPVSVLVAEHRRKGFLAANQLGFVDIYYPSSERHVLSEQVTAGIPVRLALSPRGGTLLAEDQGGHVKLLKVNNEHPEISWSSLWQRVWYEGYEKPEYVWQSSAATNDYEPKFSLTPLTFGTLKAAFYAMLFAIPLALMGAVYTAQFMRPKMRRVVKPTIEIMEALPTVILGFLAGLWLAPLVESYLLGLVCLLLLLPVGMLIAAWVWHHLPTATRNSLEGWESLLLLPLVCFLGWFSLVVSGPLEEWLFDGNIQGWLSQELGIRYDQRNAIVVGIAMGFAVIPTIFSIAEDAIFSVPGHLIRGSLALGATRWQALVTVVLPTASPAIFSALMMGFGRAVGETMIVLMATGNTPIIDFSIFDGMRTLSANIAVEIPEAEVYSTHFRVLFLAALVLFMFTFLFNTAAELIRQRLREKYSSL